MLPWLGPQAANPHSRQHAPGRAAAAAVEAARAQVAALIGAEPETVVFTSGATESDNLAVRGTVARLRGQGRDRLVTQVTEHSAVLAVAEALKAEGTAVELLPVDADGLVDPAAVGAALDAPAALVSVMAANSETGAIQDLAAIGAVCRRRDVAFHTDAAQAAGRIPVDVEAMAIDLLSLSGHKLHGPPGIGALYVRDRADRRPLPLLHGGGQERGLRPGTVPVALCVGLGVACAIARAEMADEARRTAALRDRLWQRLHAAIPGLRVAGRMDRRLPGNLLVLFPGIEAEDLILELQDDVAASSGSACATAAGAPSHVLLAMGFSPEEIAGAVRLSPGRFTTGDEIDFAAERIVAAARRLAAGR